MYHDEENARVDNEDSKCVPEELYLTAMHIFKLKNNFHGTSAEVRAEVLWHGTHYETTLSKSQMEDVKRKLCGLRSSGCACGGIRGPQFFNGRKLIVNLFTREMLAR